MRWQQFSVSQLVLNSKMVKQTHADCGMMPGQRFTQSIVSERILYITFSQIFISRDWMMLGSLLLKLLLLGLLLLALLLLGLLLLKLLLLSGLLLLRRRRILFCS